MNTSLTSDRASEEASGAVITKLLYIGDHFYFESGTSMSSIYTEDGYRYDWGFIKRDLSKGYEVHIRQATDAEVGRYERKLREIKHDRAESEASHPKGSVK